MAHGPGGKGVRNGRGEHLELRLRNSVGEINCINLAKVTGI